MKRTLGALAIFAAVVFGHNTAAFAAQFAADMVSSASGQTTQAKISVKEKKSRVEMAEMIMINRGDLGLAWMLMPTQGIYMEHPVDQKMLSRTSKEVDGETERVPMGQEAVDGQPCDKFKVTYTVSGVSESMYQWIGRNGIPLKQEALDSSWSVEYHNVTTGGLDDSLFEIPPGYQKMQMSSMAQYAAAAAQSEQ